jgi:hypothetical protein
MEGHPSRAILMCREESARAYMIPAYGGETCKGPYGPVKGLHVMWLREAVIRDPLPAGQMRTNTAAEQQIHSSLGC